MTDWQPIETAPKDRRILLGFSTAIFTGVTSIFGRWSSEEFYKKPKPYWKHDLEWLTGIKHARANQPTHWMACPEDPNFSDTEGKGEK